MFKILATVGRMLTGLKLSFPFVDLFKSVFSADSSFWAMYEERKSVKTIKNVVVFGTMQPLALNKLNIRSIFETFSSNMIYFAGQYDLIRIWRKK